MSVTFDNLLEIKSREGKQSLSTKVEQGIPLSPTSQTNSKSFVLFWLLSGLAVWSLCAARTAFNSIAVEMQEVFHWTDNTKSLVLTSNLLGLFMMQFVGGFFADKYGGKRVLITGMLCSASISFLIPFAAFRGSSVLCFARLISGFCDGLPFPCVNSMIAKFVPAKLRSTTAAITVASAYGGVVTGFGVSPFIMRSFGWQGVPYTFCVVSVLIATCWYFFSPAHGVLMCCNVTSRNEENHILINTMSEPLMGNTPKAEPKINSFTENFKKYLARKEVWAILLTFYCQGWGAYGLSTLLPSFVKDFYGRDPKASWMFTTLPFLCQSSCGMMVGYLADKLIHTYGLKLRTVRRACQLTGLLSPACALLIITNCNLSFAHAGVVLCIGVGLASFTSGGVTVSAVDIAPEAAGFVSGMGLSFMTLAGVICVPVTGYINTVFEKNWSLVFFIYVCHYVTGAVLWCFLCGDRPLFAAQEKKTEMV